jgi:hypothetical protein
VISLEEVRSEEALDGLDIEAAEVDGSAKRAVECIGSVSLQEVVKSIDVLIPAEWFVMNDLSENLFGCFASVEQVLTLEVPAATLTAE